MDQIVNDAKCPLASTALLEEIANMANRASADEQELNNLESRDNSFTDRVSRAPFVFIGRQYVGGTREVYIGDQSGELQELLLEAGALAPEYTMPDTASNGSHAAMEA